MTIPVTNTIEERAPRETRITERRVQVATLVVAKVEQQEIARRLGVSPQTVSDDVRAIRAEWRTQYAADFADHVAEHLAALDALQARAITYALGFDNGVPRLKAMETALSILDRKAKLLGLDAPSKVEVHLQIELVQRALEDTLTEMGVDVSQARPLLGKKIRELEAAATP